MDYKEYKASRNLSWDILLHEGVKELPIKVSELCENLGISVKSYRSTDYNHGFCNIIDGRPYIFIDSNAGRAAKRFTAAHELGHIMLGHVGEFMSLRRDVPKGHIDHERAADLFALRLLAPACVLWGCGVSSAEEIMSLCDISPRAAKQRMCRMRLLYKRNKFLTAEEERAIYEQFLPFISQFRQASGK